MNQSGRARRGKRGSDTRDRICAAAERLFARYGIESVSLRQIAAEAGQANVSAPIYHFGTKNQLIDEITERRSLKMEKIREDMLRDAEARGMTDDIDTILRCIFEPIRSQKDEDGNHIYAHLMVNLNLQYFRGNMFDLTDASENLPARSRIFSMLRALMTDGNLPPGSFRLTAAASIFFTILIQHDRGRAEGDTMPPLDALCDAGYVMMAKALTA